MYNCATTGANARETGNCINSYRHRIKFGRTFLLKTADSGSQLLWERPHANTNVSAGVFSGLVLGIAASATVFVAIIGRPSRSECSLSVSWFTREALRRSYKRRATAERLHADIFAD
jgi:hypothetical protein